MTARIPVSVLILTLNEEANIGRCMASVDWSDDIVVLDSLSGDGTADTARRLGARVFSRAFDDFAGQRNYALDHIDFTHEWILHLDADEVVTVELREELAAAIGSELFAAYRLAGKLMFDGRWLRFSGMYPVYQVRLGRKDALRFTQAGHGQREAIDAALVGTLQQPYLHFGFSKGLTDWLERHNRYSTAEARRNVAERGAGAAGLSGLFAMERTERRRALKSLTSRLPFRPFLRFAYMYLLRLGFLDGFAGWTYCRLMADYEYWIVLKERELRRAVR